MASVRRQSLATVRTAGAMFDHEDLNVMRHMLPRRPSTRELSGRTRALYNVIFRGLLLAFLTEASSNDLVHRLYNHGWNLTTSPGINTNNPNVSALGMWFSFTKGNTTPNP